VRRTANCVLECAQTKSQSSTRGVSLPPALPVDRSYAPGVEREALWRIAHRCARIERIDSEGETTLSLTPAPPAPSDVASLPGRAVIGRIRRVLTVSLVAVLVYSVSMGASAGFCAGGVDADGGFIDAAGRAVDEAPRCVQLTMGPSPLVFLAIALILLFALGRVMNASDESVAVRILDRSAAGVVVLVIVAIVVSQVWFRMIPLEGFMAGTASIFSPFPFGFIEVTNTPMPAP
jgi:hypothetical protein